VIRRALDPADEGWQSALGDPRAALGVDAPGATLDDPRGLTVVATDDDRARWLVRRRPVWLDGKVATFGEVLPLEGPVSTIAPEDPRDEDAVLWALTTAQQWERLELGLGFELVRTPLQLVAHPDEVRSRGAASHEVREEEACPPDVDALFQRMTGDCGALLVRDRKGIDARFPRTAGYRLVTARRAGALVGMAIFRRGMLDGVADQGLVVEWLVPVAEPEAGSALRTALAQHARAAGIERLCALLPDWTEAWMRFQHDGFHAEPTRYVLCARHRQRRHDAFWLFKRWYTTLADGSLA
jgi:hypothetical protein